MYFLCRGTKCKLKTTTKGSLDFLLRIDNEPSVTPAFIIVDLGAGGNLQSERLSVSAGSPLDLPCRLPPTADISWSREGGAPVSPYAEPMRNILRFARVGEGDSGRYICTSQGRSQYIDLSVERKFLSLILIRASTFLRNIFIYENHKIDS